MAQTSVRYPWNDDPAKWLETVAKLEKCGFSHSDIANFTGKTLIEFRNLYSVAKNLVKEQEEFRFKEGDIVLLKPTWRVIPYESIFRVIEKFKLNNGEKRYRVEHLVKTDFPILDVHNEDALETFHDLVRRIANAAAHCADNNDCCHDCPYVKWECDAKAAEDRDMIGQYLHWVETGKIK